MNSALNNRIKLPDTKPVFKPKIELPVQKKITIAQPLPPPPLSSGQIPSSSQPKQRNISTGIIIGSVVLITAVTIYVVIKL